MNMMNILIVIMSLVSGTPCLIILCLGWRCFNVFYARDIALSRSIGRDGKTETSSCEEVLMHFSKIMHTASHIGSLCGTKDFIVLFDSFPLFVLLLGMDALKV